MTRSCIQNHAYFIISGRKLARENSVKNRGTCLFRFLMVESRHRCKRKRSFFPKEKPMIILVDMDDTIEYLLKAWVNGVNEK